MYLKKLILQKKTILAYKDNEKANLLEMLNKPLIQLNHKHLPLFLFMRLEAR